MAEEELIEKDPHAGGTDRSDLKCCHNLMPTV